MLERGQGIAGFRDDERRAPAHPVLDVPGNADMVAGVKHRRRDLCARCPAHGEA